MTSDLMRLWQRGKLDVECSVCGRREAASTYCSACLHLHTPEEFHPHSDPRALHYSPGPRTLPFRSSKTNETKGSGTDA